MTKPLWNLSSRIHKLNYFPNNEVVCYVKRDDELGCGVSGSKLRKYASLMPYLMNKGIRHLIIIAGPQSNNLLAALQMAREFKLQPTAFLLKPRNLEIQGNFKLSSLFLSEQEIIWVDRHDWPKVEELAHQYLQELEEPGFVLSEGASVTEAMGGASSIAIDILNNEKSSGVNFQHIFVDAGTGFSAAALIKGLKELNHPAFIHVLLLADEENTFRHKLKNWIGSIPLQVRCFYPATARSFGAVNQTIKNEIKRLAREEGILADPIYSAKLFHSARKHIETEQLKGKVLIIHSGGTLTMAGFEW
ncbi:MULTISPECIES: pyridoxal-phosphate dependent enzyme [Legionella]|uniref:1-aminocyclopropane-1-carboxylate deaminase n=1 Tax=Legionella drozanskii LLAP-1 TaxID=1212489 RepID=A0A0W0TAE3_9GAMM|nr:MULTISPECIES: pyridoxal-phosphate dependent enzyme [Legionella]KTC92588.1 1-aminocyclopropane-1-carboxylate deaminase [Legionella drozanskii LLAP-1]PJE12294.1 MAG: 1-aminocyclopropane-1-carboxylate deaminase [Legionella sp.]